MSLTASCLLSATCPSPPHCFVLGSLRLTGVAPVPLPAPSLVLVPVPLPPLYPTPNTRSACASPCASPRGTRSKRRPSSSGGSPAPRRPTPSPVGESGWRRGGRCVLSGLCGCSLGPFRLHGRMHACVHGYGRLQARRESQVAVVGRPAASTLSHRTDSCQLAPCPAPPHPSAAAQLRPPERPSENNTWLAAHSASALAPTPCPAPSRTCGGRACACRHAAAPHAPAAQPRPQECHRGVAGAARPEP